MSAALQGEMATWVRRFPASRRETSWIVTVSPAGETVGAVASEQQASTLTAGKTRRKFATQAFSFRIPVSEFEVELAGIIIVLHVHERFRDRQDTPRRIECPGLDGVV